MLKWPARKRKRAVRINERPKSREETPKEGYDKRARLAMSHRKMYWCIAQFSNAIFAELHGRKRRAGWEEKAMARRKARQTEKRPFVARTAQV
jgi:hypothetical protein